MKISFWEKTKQRKEGITIEFTRRQILAKRSEKAKYFFPIFPSSQKLPKKFYPNLFWCNRKFGKSHTSAVKKFVKFVLQSSPPMFCTKNTRILYIQERKKIKSKIWKEKHKTNLMYCVPQESFLDYTAATYYQRLRNSGLVSEFLSNKKIPIWPAIMLIIFLIYDNDQNWIVWCLFSNPALDTLFSKTISRFTTITNTIVLPILPKWISTWRFKQWLSTK